MRTDDITKLPKWAQQLIAKQEEDIAYWRRSAESSLQDGDSPILMSKGIGEWGNLPARSTIRWEFPYEKWIEARLGDEGLEIRSQTTLWVRQVVSNCATLYPSIWDEKMRDDRPIRRTYNPLVNDPQG